MFYFLEDHKIMKRKPHRIYFLNLVLPFGVTFGDPSCYGMCQ